MPNFIKIGPCNFELYRFKVKTFFLRHSVQGGPRKVKPTTILLVTFECVGKIQ